MRLDFDGGGGAGEPGARAADIAWGQTVAASVLREKDDGPLGGLGEGYVLVWCVWVRDALVGGLLVVVRMVVVGLGSEILAVEAVGERSVRGQVGGGGRCLWW